MTEDQIDLILINDLIYHGVGIIEICVDNDGNVIRKRIDPLTVMINEKDVSWKKI